MAIPAALLALVWFAMLTLGAGAADTAILDFLYSGDRPVLATFARGFTIFGEGEVVVLISVAAAAYLLWRGHARRGLALIAVTLIGRILVNVQKYAIGRFRPENEDHLVQVYSPSFPSAHSANTMIVFLTVALLLSVGTPWARPAAYAAIALSVLVGLSRVMLGVHWPSDVVGGWVFGLLWVLIALPRAERLAGPVPRR